LVRVNAMAITCTCSHIYFYSLAIYKRYVAAIYNAVQRYIYEASHTSGLSIATRSTARSARCKCFSVKTLTSYLDLSALQVQANTLQQQNVIK